MTELLGETRSVSATAGRVASALGSAALLIVVVWLLRGVLGISSYSLDLLLAVLGFAFVGMVLRTKTNRGAVRTISNFFLNVFG